MIYFQTIKAAAVVQVRQSLLDRPGQTGDAQLLEVVATEGIPTHIGANHFSRDFPYVCVLVNCIFLMLSERLHSLRQRSFPWLYARCGPLDNGDRFEVCWLVAPLIPAEDVRVECCSHLSFGPVTTVSDN